jgi:hypothetical protein
MSVEPDSNHKSSHVTVLRPRIVIDIEDSGVAAIRNFVQSHLQWAGLPVCNRKAAPPTKWHVSDDGVRVLLAHAHSSNMSTLRLTSIGKKIGHHIIGRISRSGQLSNINKPVSPSALQSWVPPPYTY